MMNVRFQQLNLLVCLSWIWDYFDGNRDGDLQVKGIIKKKNLVYTLLKKSRFNKTTIQNSLFTYVKVTSSSKKKCTTLLKL